MVEFLRKSWFIIVIALGVVTFLFVTKEKDLDEVSSELIPIQPAVDTDEMREEQKQESIAVVDVKGEVNKPGVYEVNSESRVNDVIQLAGGFSEKANEMHVNLAQKVQDEMTIIVPVSGEASENIPVGTTSQGENMVRINNATQEEIETLSGIGPSKAQAIIQYRDDHGHFQTVEDLLEVSGIGEKTLENIQGDIQIP